MIIKVTSDITGKEYAGESYEEVVKTMQAEEQIFLNEKAEADKKALEAKQAAEEEEKKLSTIKKELCVKINEADTARKDATKHRIEVEETARQNVAKALEEARKLISDAKIAEAEANKTHWQLVAEYDEKFNKPYTKILRGKDAVEEYNRVVNEINHQINEAFKGFPFWF